MCLGIAEKTHLFMANVRWWWKEGNLGAISPIIDKILHAEVVPQPYVAPPA